MKPAKHMLGVRRSRFNVGLLATISATISMAVLLAMPGTAEATVASVPLGTDSSFAVLASSTVTNTGSSVINGNLGLSPGTSVTGFPPGTLIGSLYAADTTSATAQTDLTTAYNDAVAEGPVTAAIAGGIIGVETLTPGIYSSALSSIQLNGPLTLNGNNNPNSVFVFQAGSTVASE